MAISTSRCRPYGSSGMVLSRDVGELEPGEQLHRLVDHVAALACRRNHAECRADALGDRHVDVLQHGEPAEQPVDLKRPRDAELDPLRLLDLVMS